MSECSIDGCDSRMSARGWCRTHYSRWQRRGGDPAVELVASECRDYARIPAPDRFWARVEKTESCWLWTGATADTGYGTFWLPGKGANRTSTHRWSYQQLVGPIPEGLELDHLCRVRNCVNPAHLEPVTHAENVRRWAATITHCPQGHEYTPENSSYRKRGGRECRTCHRDRERARQRRIRQARAA